VVPSELWPKLLKELNKRKTIASFLIVEK